ncbi:5145_t:CDS:2, partial [Entrophospora sp. SA101]
PNSGIPIDSHHAAQDIGYQRYAYVHVANLESNRGKGKWFCLIDLTLPGITI